MKTYFRAISFYSILLLYSVHTFSQEIDSTSFKESRELVDTIKSYDEDLNVLNFRKVNRYENILEDKNDKLLFGLIDTTKALNRNEVYYSLYKNFEAVADILYRNEYGQRINFGEISVESLSIIQSINEINILQGILRAVEEKLKVEDGYNQVIRASLIDAISKQMNIVANNTLPWYNYNSTEKQLVKGLVLNTSNDLFTPMGMILGNWVKENSLFQENSDMDYTGSLKIGIVTDYLKPNRIRPIKSYQTLFLGADVYTPYFKDTSIFYSDTSFNVNDRPHGSFQYFGLESNAVSWNYGFRWSTQLRVGKIGGDKSNVLQSVLHQDISYSPRPSGWGAQIADGGRLGFNINYKPEVLLRNKKVASRPSEKFWSIFPSLIGDIGIGTFMTYGELGFHLSNKNFYSSNQDNLCTRPTIDPKSFLTGKYVMISLKGRIRYVVHNTMLEGYGMFKTTEDKNDAFTPKSLYTLDYGDVQRVVGFFDLTIAKQTKYFNLFYRFSVKSPEFKSDGQVFNDEGRDLKINKRWHHYATWGISFKF